MLTNWGLMLLVRDEIKLISSWYENQLSCNRKRSPSHQEIMSSNPDFAFCLGDTSQSWLQLTYMERNTCSFRRRFVLYQQKKDSCISHVLENVIYFCWATLSVFVFIVGYLFSNFLGESVCTAVEDQVMTRCWLDPRHRETPGWSCFLLIGDNEELVVLFPSDISEFWYFSWVRTF